MNFKKIEDTSFNIWSLRLSPLTTAQKAVVGLKKQQVEKKKKNRIK